MTRHRWYDVAFCSKRCREKYLDKLARDRDRLKKWLRFGDQSARGERSNGPL